MIRQLILVIACAILCLNPLVTHADIKLVPKCLAGFCLDAESLPTEKAVRTRFGGFRQPAPGGALAYCYQFSEPNQQSSFGRFLFKKNFGSEWRLVAIRLSKTPVCSNQHVVQLKHSLSTKEGIHLNSEEAEIFSIYGQPRYVLHPPPEEVVREFFDSLLGTTIDVVDQYVSSNEKDLSAAFFYISGGQVAGIEISADE